MRATGAIAQFARLWRRGSLLLLFCAIAAYGSAHAANPQSDVTSQPSFRFRVAWGGGTAARWQMRASIDKGELRELDLLGRQRDTPGSLWLADGIVYGLQPRPRQFDGFDITAVAENTATLRIELLAAGSEESRVFEATIDQLLNQQQRLAIDDSGNSLIVHRADDDALRLDVDDDDLIFAPGEVVRFTVEPALLGIAPGASLDLSVEVVEGRHGRTCFSESQRVALPARGTVAVPWQVTLPAEQGVYTVNVVARHPPANRVPFWGGTGKQEPLATRKFQVVAIDPRPVSRYASPQWNNVVEIDPANPRWWNRLPDWSRLGRWTGASTGPTGNRPFRTSQYHGLTLAELPPAEGSDTPWQAYLLAGARPGEPHLVEIDLPRDQPLQMALRVYEEDAAGQLQPAGAGRGIAIDDWVPTDESSKLVTYRLLIWPRTNSPILVVQNAHRSRACRYGTIRLLHASSQPAPVVNSRSTATHPVLARFSWDGLKERMAVGHRDPGGRMEIDDRKTFYDAAQRLADFLELGGYSGAVVTVLADGGNACQVTSYPLSPRFNTHALGAGTCDLPAIDPLDIFLEVFEQRGLTFTPSLCFNFTLPALEEKIRQTRSSGDPWVVADMTGRGRTLTGSDGLPGAPHYDFHEGLLEQEVVDVIARLLDRYGQHPALGDIAVELSADSYLVLPPPTFGLVPERINRFAATLDVEDKTRKSWLQSPSLIVNDSRTRGQWIAMRASEMTKVWQNIGGRIRATHPDKKLLLLCDQMFAARDYQGAVRPRLIGGPKLEELYLERGLDLEGLARLSHVVVPSTVFDTAGLPLPDAATSMHFNEIASRSRPLSSVGLLVTKKPRLLPDPAVNGTESTFYRPITFDHPGKAEQRLMVHLWQHACSGPVVLGNDQGPSGDVVGSRGALHLAQQLSLTSTGNIASEQPLVVHVGKKDKAALVTAVNPTPWQLTATVTLDVDAASPALRIAPESNEPQATNFSRGKHAWSVVLSPYGMEGIAFESARVSVTGVRTKLDEQQVTATLGGRLKELVQRDLSARQPYEALLNPSFEELDIEGNPFGWHAEGNEAPTGTNQLSVSPGLHGERALRLFSANDGVAMSSEPFAVPPTGQLAMIVYVSPVDLAEDAEVRLVMEEVGGNSPPRHVAALSAKRLLEEQKSQDWIGYRFGVEELPLDTHAKMRLRFELVGRGEVAIDGIELYQVVFPLDLYQPSEYQRLAIAQRIESAQAALDQRRFNDCLHELESYWARFLLAYLPPVTELPEQVAAPSAPSKEQEPPAKVGSRLRDWFNFR